MPLFDQDPSSIDSDSRKAQEKRDKEYAKAMKNSPDLSAEEEYFKDKRLKKEGKGELDLSGKQEAMQKLREFSSGQRSGASLKGGAGTGGGGAGEIKSLQNPRAMKKGGKIKSASSRADGCCIRGKTKA